MTNQEQHEANKRAAEQARGELAAVYARVFGSEDGKRIMLDLVKKFGHSRPRFRLGEKTGIVDAALIDGQCSVLKEIQDAIALGSPTPHP